MTKARGRPRKTTEAEVGTDNQTDQQVENSMQEAVEISEVIEQPKKKGTRPGWKPSGQLPKLKAPSGFTPKWCSPAKLTERRSEGWVLMKPSDNKGEEIINIDVNDSGALTGALRYRDLVAIMLPKKLKEARDEWLKNENAEAMRGILKETDEKFKEGGASLYTPKGQSGRVVIE